MAVMLHLTIKVKVKVKVFVVVLLWSVTLEERLPLVHDPAPVLSSISVRKRERETGIQMTER